MIKANSLVVVVKKFCDCSSGQVIGRIFTVESTFEDEVYCIDCGKTHGKHVIARYKNYIYPLFQLREVDGFDPDTVEQEDLELMI